MFAMRRWVSATGALALVVMVSLLLGLPGGQGSQAQTRRATAIAQCNGVFSNGTSINLANPTFLQDVPQGQLFCDFHTFAWNQFIYLTQMKADPNNGGQVTPLFMHLAPWYNMLPQTGTAQPGAFPGGSTALLTGPNDNAQAGDQDQLVDVNGKTVLYDIRYNENMYNSVVFTQKLYTPALFDQACAQVTDKTNPNYGNCTNPMYLPWEFIGPSRSPANGGALEVKTSWRDFGSPGACPTATFYCNGRFGLVGMHIVQKTKTHGEWVWASFEHQANAPDCNAGGDSPIPSARPPGKPWSFFDPATAAPDVFATQTCKVTAPAQCNADPHASKTTYKQVNVCRTDVIAGGGASAANCAVVPDGPPQQSSNSKGNVACLNATLQPKRSGIWRNYKMIGSLWIRGTTSPTVNFAVQVFQPAPTSGPPALYSEPVGFPNLANTTMETWLQSGSTGYDPFASSTSYGTNATTAGCFLCHNLPSTGSINGRTADLSHFPARLGTGKSRALVPANSSTPVTQEMLRLPRPAGVILRGAQPTARTAAQ